MEGQEITKKSKLTYTITCKDGDVFETDSDFINWSEYLEGLTTDTGDTRLSIPFVTLGCFQMLDNLFRKKIYPHAIDMRMIFECIVSGNYLIIPKDVQESLLTEIFVKSKNLHTVKELKTFLLLSDHDLPFKIEDKSDVRQCDSSSPPAGFCQIPVDVLKNEFGKGYTLNELHMWRQTSSYLWNIFTRIMIQKCQNTFPALKDQIEPSDLLEFGFELEDVIFANCDYRRKYLVTGKSFVDVLTLVGLKYKSLKNLRAVRMTMIQNEIDDFIRKEHELNAEMSNFDMKVFEYESRLNKLGYRNLKKVLSWLFRLYPTTSPLKVIRAIQVDKFDTVLQYYREQEKMLLQYQEKYQILFLMVTPERYKELNK